MLKNVYLDAKICVDKAEKEPSFWGGGAAERFTQKEPAFFSLFLSFISLFFFFLRAMLQGESRKDEKKCENSSLPIGRQKILVAIDGLLSPV